MEDKEIERIVSTYREKVLQPRFGSDSTAEELSQGLEAVLKGFNQDLGSQPKDSPSDFGRGNPVGDIYLDEVRYHIGEKNSGIHGKFTSARGKILRILLANVGTAITIDDLQKATGSGNIAHSITELKRQLRYSSHFRIVSLRAYGEDARRVVGYMLKRVKEDRRN